MTEDPLERHHGLIAVAERGQQAGHDHVVGLQCIADLAAALRAERTRIAELETKCERCGLKVAHEPTPGVTVLESELTFTPGELVYVPATVRYYPSETPGEPDVKEITYP